MTQRLHPRQARRGDPPGNPPSSPSSSSSAAWSRAACAASLAARFFAFSANFFSRRICVWKLQRGGRAGEWVSGLAWGEFGRQGRQAASSCAWAPTVCPSPQTPPLSMLLPQPRAAGRSGRRLSTHSMLGPSKPCPSSACSAIAAACPRAGAAPAAAAAAGRDASRSAARLSSRLVPSLLRAAGRGVGRVWGRAAAQAAGGRRRAGRRGGAARWSGQPRSLTGACYAAPSSGLVPQLGAAGGVAQGGAGAAGSAGKRHSKLIKGWGAAEGAGACMGPLGMRGLGPWLAGACSSPFPCPNLLPDQHEAQRQSFP